VSENKVGSDELERYQRFPPFVEMANGGRDYLRRFFFVRTLNLIIGRFAVEETRVLLRRRRRSWRASADRKRRAIQTPAMTATPRIASRTGLSKFTQVYLAHAVGM
jgi:hypothetical protein